MPSVNRRPLTAEEVLTTGSSSPDANTRRLFGIYEYRNRAYHPGLGRFLSEDPMGFAAGDSNMFRYCGGDPVNWTDPFGLHHVTGDQKIYNTEDIYPGAGTTTSEPVPGTLHAPFDFALPASGSSSSGSGVSAGAGELTGFGGLEGIGGLIGSPGGLGSDSSGSFGPAFGGNGLGILGGGGDSHSSGDSGGPGGGFLSNIVNWARGVASAATMFGEFVSNSGPQVRIFGPNSVESADLRTDPMLMAKAAEAYASPDGKSTVRTFPFPMGPIQAAYHPTRQFVGSYTVEIRNGQAVVMNRTSLWSGLGHFNFVGAPDRTETPFGGNTYQAYIIGPYPRPQIAS